MSDETGSLDTADILEVLGYLPHRYPFLLVDRVLELEPGRRVLALKNVSVNEPFFPGHWPERPIMPGVLIIEALAQAGALDGEPLRVLARYHRPTTADPHGRPASDAIAAFELAPVGELVG